MTLDNYFPLWTFYVSRLFTFTPSIGLLFVNFGSNLCVEQLPVESAECSRWHRANLFKPSSWNQDWLQAWGRFSWAFLSFAAPAGRIATVSLSMDGAELKAEEKADGGANGDRFRQGRRRGQLSNGCVTKAAFSCSWCLHCNECCQADWIWRVGKAANLS